MTKQTYAFISMKLLDVFMMEVLKDYKLKMVLQTLERLDGNNTIKIKIEIIVLFQSNI